MGVVKGSEVATIDVALVTVQSYKEGADEIALDTSNKVDVTVATETEDKIALIVKGRLIAQKPPVTTVTGNTITLTDNVFNDRLVQMLQGGTIKYENGVFAGYTPPKVGSNEKGEIFKLRIYSAIYNAAGVLTGYERITYPNCQGQPIAFSSEDGTFRASDYTIDSAPANGEAPYDLDIVSDLPTSVGALTVVSVEGTNVGDTAITVTPAKAKQTNIYKVLINPSVTIPIAGQDVSSYDDWDGSSDITAANGNEILVVEADRNGLAEKAGKTFVVSKE